MKKNIQRKKPGRKPVPPGQKSVKRSISFPPKMWAWIKARAGYSGVPARIVQEAVMLLQESGQRDLAVSEKSEAVGQQKVKKALKKLQGGGACC